MERRSAAWIGSFAKWKRSGFELWTTKGFPHCSCVCLQFHESLLRSIRRNSGEEWNEFGDFLITVIQELIPELIPGVAEVIAIKDAFNNFNNGEYISANTDLSLALIGFFTVGKLLKATAKFAKGLRIVVRLSKSFKNAKKKVKAVSNGDLTEAYSLWSKIGCKSTTSYKRVRELNNTTERQAKSFYELLTKKVKISLPIILPLV